MDGNLKALDRYLSEQDRYEKTALRCDICSEIITTEKVHVIHNDIWCDRCLKETERWVEDLERS